MGRNVLLVFLSLLLLLGGCTQPEADISQSVSSDSSVEQPVSSSATADKQPVKEDLVEASASAEDPISDHPVEDFSKLYPEKMFLVRVVDPLGNPVTNATMHVNLDWQGPQRHLTDMNGEVWLFLPRLEFSRFVEGDYEFQIVRQTIAEPTTETVSCHLTQENTAHGYTLQLAVTAGQVDWNSVLEKTTLRLVKGDTPVRNQLVRVAPADYIIPENSVINFKLIIEQYTDDNGCVYYPSLPTGKYSAAALGKRSLLLAHYDFEVQEESYESFTFVLP